MFKSQNESDYPQLHKLLALYREVIQFHEASKFYELNSLRFKRRYRLEDVNEKRIMRLQKKYQKRMNFKMTKLIHHFMTKFPTVMTDKDEEWTAEIEQVSMLFFGTDHRYNSFDKVKANKYVNTLWDVPPTLLPQVIIIAILRDALAQRKMIISPNDMIMKVRNKDVNIWDKFANAYLYLILRA